MKLFAVLVQLIVFGFVKNSEAIKCLECSDVPHPAACNKITTCPTNFSCSLTQYITSSGVVLFSSGCLSKKSCSQLHQIEKTNGTEDTHLDTMVCKECCDDRDYCNQEGCGEKGVDFNKRGSYCFECPVEDPNYGCRTITQCRPGESCFLDEGSFRGYFKTGCRNATECPLLVDPSRSSRALMLKQLPFCCKADFCNDIGLFVETNNVTKEVAFVGWSPWSEWSSCSYTCGVGAQTRNRTCDNSTLPCTGSDIETTLCPNVGIDCPAPINGGWSMWTEWSSCSHTCGYSTRTRARTCDNPVPQHNGYVCSGPSRYSAICRLPQCQVNGSWSSWSTWSSCSSTCGSDVVRFRNRSCDNPPPSHNGMVCQGDDNDTISCNLTSCPVVYGGWSSWSEWSSCSHTCGAGAQTRNRTCNNSTLTCTGSDIETTLCPNVEIDCPAPINGGWSAWTEWSRCSHTCGYAIHTRTRTCNNPIPKHNGYYCDGSARWTAKCSLPECQVNGSWSSWSTWSSCSSTCGSDVVRFRNRSCDNPAPSHNGMACQGDGNNTVSCNLTSCPVVGGWSSWGEWSSCSHTCGTGAQTRNRTCDNSTLPCTGSDIETTLCPNVGIDCPAPINGRWSAWTEWSSCSHTCGFATKTHTRACDNPVPQHNGFFCDGSSQRTTICRQPACQDPRCNVTEGFQIVQYGKARMCLRISHQTHSWSTSREDCHKYNADLVSIRNQDEDKALNKFLHQTNSTCLNCNKSEPQRVWIGLYENNDSFYWVNSNVTYGYHGYRNNTLVVPQRGYCGLAGDLNSGWFIQSCYRTFKYVCQINLS